MASLEKTIDIVLKGEDRASKKIDDVNASFKRMGTRFKSFATIAAEVAAALATVGAGLTALAGAGLKEAYERSVTLETAMTDLKKVLGDQPQLMDQAKDSAIEMSNKYGIAAADITDSITGWVQAGYDLENAVKMTEQSIFLMISSELDAAASTTTLTKLVKGFGLEVEDVEGKLDAINSVTQAYATDTGKLAEALSRVAPIADSMGISLEQMAAWITPVIEKFQNGEKAGTAFVSILANMVNPTGQSAEALKTMGLYQKIVNGEFDSGQEIVQAVIEKFQGLDENQQTFIATQIAGKEHFAKFIGAFSDAEKTAAIYETAMGKAATVTEEVRNQLESSENIIKIYRESWANLAAKIGDEYNEAVDEVIKGSALIAAALQDTVDEGAMEPVFKAIRDIFNNLADELQGMAEALPEAMEMVDWQNLADALRSVGDAFGSLFDGVDLSDPEQLAQEIQRVVDAGSNLIQFFAKTVEYSGRLTPMLKSLADGFNFIGNSLRDADSWEDYFFSSIEGMVSTVKWFLEQLALMPEAVRTAIPSIPSGNLQPAIDAIGAMQEKIQGATADSKEFKDATDTWPDRQKISFEVRGTESIDDLHTELSGIPQSLWTLVNVGDDGSAQETKNDIDQTIPEEKAMKLRAEVEKTELKKDIAEIEAQADIVQTKVEWKAKIDISEIDAKADIVQTAIEWKAKVDITDAQAEADKMVSLADSISAAWDSTATSISAAYSALDPDMTHKQWRSITSLIDEELTQRDRLLDMQEELVSSQTAYMDAKIQAMQDNEGLIQIDGAGLQPHLEAFMWEILSAIQTRVNEEGLDMLTGTPNVTPA